MKSGDIMNYETMSSLFESKKKVEFKLYSLDYLIEEIDNIVQVYAIDYPTRKSKYNSFKEAMNSFTVYNESLITLLDKLKIKMEGGVDESTNTNY